MPRFKISGLVVLSIFTICSPAYALTPENNASQDAGLSSYPPGPFALVEWNPADLAKDRIRVSGEYAVIDGFAFGAALEQQEQSFNNWKHSIVAVGVTATQYLQSQSLRGLFVKGEFDLFFGNVKVQPLRREDDVYGASFGADAGYRFSLMKNFTGAASYGVRRPMPGFFQSEGSSVQKYYEQNLERWDYRVQLALGVSF